VRVATSEGMSRVSGGRKPLRQFSLRPSMKLIIEVDVNTNLSVMRMHYESIKILIQNYLSNQAYERNEYEVNLVEIKAKNETTD